MLNVNQITSRLAMMPDQALKQFAQMHKDDPYTFSLAVSESNRRKEVRAGSHSFTQQPKVADSAIAQMDAPRPEAQMVLPEEQGIGTLPAPNMQGMAGGGIVAFDRGGKAGDVGAMQYRKYAMDRAQEMGLDPSFVNAIFTYESNYKPKAKSPTGPVGIGQLTAATGSAYGVTKEDRKDPYKNMDAALAYMVDLQKKYNGDQQKMAVAYNQGEPFLDRHLKQHGGELVPAKLSKKEPKTYLQKVGEIMTAAIPSAQAGELPPAPAAKPSQVQPKPVEEEVDHSPIGQLKRIYQGMGSVGERIAPKEQLYSPSGKPLEDTRGFFERAAGNMGLSEEAQRNISNTLNATAGYTAPLRIPAAVGKLSAAEEAARLAKNAQADEAAAAAAAKVANLRLPSAVTPSGAKGVAALSEEEKVRRGLATPTPVPPKPVAGLEALSDAERAKRGLAPKAKEFPLSPEAVEMNKRVAAARAAQKAAPVAEEVGAARKTYPLGADALKMNEELAAAKNAQALRNMKADEQAAANAAKLAEETKLGTKAEEGLEAINATQKANRLNQVIRPVNAIADAARLENASDVIGSGFPSSSEEQAAQAPMADDNREKTSLLNRYPAPAVPASTPYYQPDNTRGYPAKEIIQTAKDATPDTAATKGFTNDDWLNLGFNLLAGKSQYALENLGTAGVATLAAKREREKSEAAAANALQVAGTKGEWRGMVKDLMDANPNMSYQDALGLVMRGRTGAEAKEEANRIRADAQQESVLRDADAAVRAISADPRYKMLAIPGAENMPGYDTTLREYQRRVNAAKTSRGLKPDYEESSNKYPGVKVLGVTG